MIDLLHNISILPIQFNIDPNFSITKSLMEFVDIVWKVEKDGYYSEVEIYRIGTQYKKVLNFYD